MAVSYVQKLTAFLVAAGIAQVCAADVPWSFEQLRSLESTKKVNVACVGDSITQNPCNVAAQKMDYPSQLQRLLGTEKYNVFNFGVSGHTLMKQGLCGPLEQCTGNCSWWATPAAPAAFQSEPDFVFIMLGTNDAKKCNIDGKFEEGRGLRNFIADYVDLIHQFQALPTQPAVYALVAPPYVLDPQSNHTKWEDDPSLFDIGAINELYPAVVKRIAAEAGAAGVIDMTVSHVSGRSRTFPW
eukprot:TRINITY_DN53848_c0_g1_i2.p1 TRINITY_DN53848_c0_g1~~TRINITY_DN53848_c0_g1_i2.p1  ORF type:complete len:241 (-),score=27.28 TRINITY_DN53848_c0_g1_i2:30-752(-)